MIPREIIDKIEGQEMLSATELEALHHEAGLAELGMLAHGMRNQKTDPTRVTYIVDRNINYTNICTSGCRFCAFFRPPGHPEGYVMRKEVLGAKIREAQKLGAVQILLQGGLHPDLDLDFYVDMLRCIKGTYGIHVHGFSPPEIRHIAALEDATIREVIRVLKDAGLDSIPGGGAEVLSPESRGRLSPKKCTKEEWLEVMGQAHEAGLRTTATMMFGHGESLSERIEHFIAIRELQEATGGFTAFIPWTFQPGNTQMARVTPAGGHAYLRMLALSRIALYNIENFQVSWVTQGARVAQAALFCGANDFGSTMIEENVVAAAGVSDRMTIEEIERLIRAAGFEPARRNQAYEVIEGAGRA